jgi:hypothetical protein
MELPLSNLPMREHGYLSLHCPSWLELRQHLQDLLGILRWTAVVERSCFEQNYYQRQEWGHQVVAM